MALVNRQRLPNTRNTGGSQNNRDEEHHGDKKCQHDDETSLAPPWPWRHHWTFVMETQQLRQITIKRAAIAVVCVGVFVLVVRCHNICFSFISYYHRHDKTIRVVVPPPIMVQSESEHFTNAAALPLEPTNTEPLRYIQNRENRYWINHEIRKHKDPEQVPEGCVAEADWMSDVHPSCNNVHEVDTKDFFFNPQRTTVRIISNDDGRRRHHRHRQKFRLIGKGGFRAAFLFHESEGTRRVLKTLLFRRDRNFTPRTFDRMRRDAVASEQLTSSKYVVDIYGYCGMSALVDYSDSDDMLSLFENKTTTSPNKDELFQIAHDVAQSVADAHHLNEHGRATIVHMDIKPNQWIKFDGRWMLNDFNVAKFLTWDPQTKKNCGLASGYSEGRWQAPEQFINESPRSEKADIFALGYVLNFLITGKKPFPDLDGRQVQDTVTNGTMWEITDPEILESNHPFDVSVRKAVELCLVFDPEKRPRAQTVADLLRKALDEYNQSKRSK